jgi:hypothetical protein
MGLLAPLYIAGLAALSLPLLLHLIRRTPRGRQAFSSLMFLTPSPPRLTRRSRLDHVLLLVMRLAALALLALAFARPFLREAAMLPLDNMGSRRVAILLDTSASMRRDDLWRQAQNKVEGVIKDLGPKDDVALFTFDDRLHAIVDFAQDASEPITGKADLVRQRLRTVSPSWASTDLAGAMTAVASELESATDDRQLASEPELVLITDLAGGSRLDGLQGYKWPDSVPVVAHVLSARRTTNAAIQLLTGEEETATAEPRVRVTNTADSAGDQFSIGWRPSLNRGVGRDGEGTLATYVPAGQSRVIRLPRPADAVSVDRIVLSGDETEFDNTFYVVPPLAQRVKVAWFGGESDDDTRSPRYYFDLAVADDPLRKIEIESRKPDDAWQYDASNRPDLVVATSAIPAQLSDALSNFVRGGGTLLVLLEDADGLASLAMLLDDVVMAETSSAAEGDGTSTHFAGTPVPATLDKRAYALLGEIDFTHPLFGAFANPRYSDFTKIHFWRHRAVTVEPAAATRVVARFDNGDPAILERAIGAGRVLLFTSGWQPEESQLALASKFVPLIQALLDMACGGPVRSANLIVGQEVPLPARSTLQPITVQKPDGTRVAIANDAAAFDGADQPGIYRLRVGNNEYPFAVNLATAESNTVGMELDRLEQLGVRFASQLTRADRAAKLRQQRDIELESHQQLWRWLIVATIGLLIVETWLAGRTARWQEAELSPT